LECLAKTIHVPADYPTIQEAINLALPGDTVKVAEGKYRESVRMHFEVNLIGAGAGKSKIKPIDDTTKKPIVITSDRCILEGFTFLGATKNSPAAILVENTSPTIRNNVIKRNLTIGILVKHKKASPLIEHNRIYKNKYTGIKVLKTGGRIIANELFDNFGPGISLLDAYSAIENNYIYKNHNTGITTGIARIKKSSEESQDPFIHKNKIENNKAGGIATDNSSPSIIGNTISSKGKPTILLFSSNSVIKDNKLTSSGPPAIRINNTSSPIVENNVINGTLRFAIINDSKTARIRNNTINSKWTPGIPIK
jgi:parallel beta-helix repeat protein